MVKRQKEKQYQSAREHKANAAIRAGSASLSYSKTQQQLPFDACALTLTQFQNPSCLRYDDKGIIFETTALVEFINQHQKDPIQGKSLTTRQVISLQMDRDDETNAWQCPVLGKPFSNHTKSIAILNQKENTAYVYSYEAYHELNVKAKNWTDLTTGIKFHKTKDVFVLYDPNSQSEFHKFRDIQSFWHITNGRSNSKIAGNNNNNNQSNSNVKHSVTATRIMEQIKKSKKEQQQKEQKSESSNPISSTPSSSKRTLTMSDIDPTSTKKIKIYKQDVTGGASFTTGKASSSLTSTAMVVTSHNETTEATTEDFLQAQIDQMKKAKKVKGLVVLNTNMGDLLLEIHTDIVPRTCINFLTLCEQGEYDNTIFHRLIPNFMMQGGKESAPHTPAKSSSSDSSIWNKPFVDEFDSRLVHDAAGIVSMANAGSNTNKRQFFITFGPCPHLDNKHSIFGTVIQGMEQLKQMEKVQTNTKNNRPIQPIILKKAEVLSNPATEAKTKAQELIKGRIKHRIQQQEGKTLATTAKKQSSVNNNNNGDDTNNNSTDTKSTASTKSVGKYLKIPKHSILDDTNTASIPTAATLPKFPKSSKKQQPAPKKQQQYGDFSGW